MLVIISDLHLTDGTSGETIRPHAFKIFQENLRDTAYEASWRIDGTYKPIEKLDIILLGDILDVIRSTKWLDAPKGVRPWSNYEGDDFKNMIKTINDAILKQNEKSLSVIKGFSTENAITLPPATKDGKPAEVSRDPSHKDRIPVEVNTHYMVGNHDWFYHLPGEAYNEIRRAVIDATGLANPADMPFPHEPEESDTIMGLFRDHRVYARHGDIYDHFNYEEDRNASSIGDVIVVELLNRFPDVVEKQLGRYLPQETLDGLKEIDNVRPLLMIPIWVEGLLRRTCPDSRIIKEVKGVWNDLVNSFLKVDFIREKDTMNPFDEIDRLELALKFTRGISLNKVNDLLAWVNEKTGGASSSYAKNAQKEIDFKNRRARFIIYGHTHRPEIVPLDSAAMGSGILNQVYLNSGTWRRVHELAQVNPDEQEFIGYYVTTYLAFFKGAERSGRSFESWSGALG